MIVTRKIDTVYSGDSILVHRISDSVTIKNSYGLCLGMSMNDAKELYDLLGTLIADNSKENK